MSSGSECFLLPLSLFSELTSPQVPVLQDRIISLFRAVFSKGSIPKARSAYRRGSRTELSTGTRVAAGMTKGGFPFENSLL